MSGVIPVIAVSWYFGFKWGVCVGILFLPINIMMASFVGLDWWNKMIIDGALIQGTLGLAFIGGIVGHMSDLSQRLKEHRDHLNRLVQERTADLTRSNEQLKVNEMQLRSAMEQFEASNQQLIASESELLESKAFLENIFETNMDGIIVGDEQGVFVKVNHALEKITGYSEKELIGMHSQDLVEDEKQLHGAIIIESLKKGEIRNLELSWRRKDGSLCPLEFNVKLLKDDSGNVTGSVGSVRDISERKKAESDLKESEERLNLSFEATNDGLWDWRLLTNEVFFSPRYYTMLGYDPYELPAVFETWQNLVHPEDVEHAMQKIADHIAQRSLLYEQEFRMKTKSGEFRWILARGKIVEQGADGEPVRMLGIHTDITERKKIEHEKQQLLEQLRQTQKMEEIGTLAGGVAHDFNNILGVIIGYAEISLDDLPEGSRMRDDIKEILIAADRAKDLVNQILTFSRQADQELKIFRIKPLVEEFFGLIRATFPTTIEIRKEIKAESDVVMSNPTQIHQVLMNLCTNAKQAMQEKGGVLELSLTEETIDKKKESVLTDLSLGKYLKIKVSDTGCGMDPVTIKRVFDPFFTTKDQGKGTGLGLSVVHGIVKSYGGEISVFSEQGKGTTFCVYLPLADPSSPVQETLLPEKTTGGNEHILLVDDEEVVCDMTKKNLEKLGYAVTSRTSSIEALELFKKMPDKFDLVITDQTMPNLTGADLAKKLILIRPDIPIILCTGFSETINRSQALHMGIRAYIEKPVVREQLDNAIRKIFDETE